MRKQRGFSLIELLIVVAIILIIAAIALPNLMRSKAAANEASAVASTRTLVTAQATYGSSYGFFADTLAKLGPVPSGSQPGSATAGLIDDVLASGTKSGYAFSPGGGTADTFSYSVAPSTPGTTGNKYLFTDQTGVIRFNVGSAASATSPALAN
jgi:type IV pilus assembly protein PilA